MDAGLSTSIVLPPAFRRLAWSNLLAQGAEQIGLATAPLLAVFMMNASTSQTAWLQMVQSLPFLLLALPAGVLADRHSRKSVLAWAEALRALSFAMILLLLAMQGLTLAWLAVLGCVGAAGTVAYNVASPGLVPTLVPRDGLSLANSRLELARSVAFTAGPGVAGVFFNALGASFAYCIALAASLCAVHLLRLLPADRPALTHRRAGRELVEGMRFTFGHPLLRPVLATAVIFNMSWFILQAAYVPYAASHLGMSAQGIGAALGVYGLGMVTGALLAPRLGRHVAFGTMIFLGPLGGFLGACLMAVSVMLPHAGWIWFGFFFFGAGPVLWSITTATLRQAVTPSPLIGRVSAVVLTCTFGARPLGAAIAAIIGLRWGASACIVAAAVGFAAQLAIISLSPVPRLRRIPASAND